MIILSVDYGDARTGLAVCDRGQLLASPVGVIAEPDAERLVLRIAEAARDCRAEALVVGLPKNMDGSEGARAQACRAFAALLAEQTGLPTELFDERLTTVAAHRALNETNTRGKKRKNVVDAVAAVMILEDYLRFLSNRDAAHKT